MDILNIILVTIAVIVLLVIVYLSYIVGGFWLNYQFKKCPSCNSRSSKFLNWVKPKNDLPFSAYKCKKCNSYFAIYEGKAILRSEFKWNEHDAWNNN